MFGTVNEQCLFQEITTERLLLRRLLPEDAESLYSYRSMPEVCKFQSWEPQSLEEVQAFIDNMSSKDFGVGWYQIGITLRTDGTLIGDCGIHSLESDSRIGEVGITLNPAFQSKGYATEALRAVLEFLFVGLGKHRVFASVDPRNHRSMMLLDRVGLRKEGHFRESLWIKNEWVDDVVFAALASEWCQVSGR